MKITAVIMIALALVIGILPQFTDCDSHGRQITLADGRTIPMKCHWTARAEIGVAAPLFMVGMLSFNKRRTSQRSLGILGGILGIAVILLPTALIGVCGSPEMICNSTMKPALIISGSLVIVLSAIGVVRSFRSLEEGI